MSDHDNIAYQAGRIDAQQAEIKRLKGCVYWTAIIVFLTIIALSVLTSFCGD